MSLDLCADLSTGATSVSGAQDYAVVTAQNGHCPWVSRKGKGNPWMQDAVVVGESVCRVSRQEEAILTASVVPC